MSEQKPIARTEIYSALAGVNTSLETVVENLKVLLDEGVIAEDYFREVCEKLETIRREVSIAICQKMSAVEAAEVERLRKLRNSLESPFHRNGNGKYN